MELLDRIILESLLIGVTILLIVEFVRIWRNK